MKKLFSESFSPFVPLKILTLGIFSGIQDFPSYFVNSPIVGTFNAEAKWKRFVFPERKMSH